MAEERKTIGHIIDDTTCYTDNVSELLKEFRLKYTDAVTGAVLPDLGFSEVVDAINILFSKIKETALECEGEVISIPAPQGTAGSIITLLTNAIGLNLFD
jgi:hypothetical protein